MVAESRRPPVEPATSVAGPSSSLGAEAVSDGWTAHFEEADEDSSEPPPPPPPQPPQPLPAERVDTIRQAMAGFNLAVPPPNWATTVPESVWMQQLLRRTPTDNRKPSSSSASSAGDSHGDGRSKPPKNLSGGPSRKAQEEPPALN